MLSEYPYFAMSGTVVAGILAEQGLIQNRKSSKDDSNLHITKFFQVRAALPEVDVPILFFPNGYQIESRNEMHQQLDLVELRAKHLDPKMLSFREQRTSVDELSPRCSMLKMRTSRSRDSRRG